MDDQDVRALALHARASKRARTCSAACTHHARIHAACTHRARTTLVACTHCARTTLVARSHALTPRSSHLPHHILRQEVKKQIQLLQMGLDFVSPTESVTWWNTMQCPRDQQRHQKQRHQHRQGRRPDQQLGPGYRTGSRSIAHTHTPYSYPCPVACTHASRTQAKVAQCSPNPVPALAAAREQNLHSDGKGGDLPSYQSYPLTTANWAEFASQRQRRDGPGSRGSGGCR